MKAIKSLSTKQNIRYRVIIFTLFSLLFGSGLALLPFVYAAGVALLIAGIAGVFLAYRWPEFFLVLTIWTYFLKFTFIFSVAGLGITPFMIFQALTLTGYGLRILTGKQRFILPVGLGFLLLFIGFTTLSLLIIRDLDSALGLYFRTTLDWLLMLLLIQMITDRHNIKRLIIALLFQAVIIISWGMIDAFQSWLSGRPLISYSSFFWNQFRKNDFAVYLAFVSLLSLVILLRRRNVLEKFLSLLLLTPIPVAWLLTRSRTGLLALVISLFLFLILERNGRLLRLLLTFSVIGVMSFAAFPSQERDLVIDGIRAFINPENVIAERNVETISRRFLLMEVGWEVFTSNPILGVGFNQWQYYSPITNNRRDARTGERVEDPLEIHNRYLQIATNNGLFAIVGYLGFVSVLLFLSFRTRRKARGLIRSLFNALIAFLVTLQITFMVTTGFLFEWLIFGILMGLINVTEIEESGDLAKRRWFKFKLNW